MDLWQRFMNTATNSSHYFIYLFKYISKLLKILKSPSGIQKYAIKAIRAVSSEQRAHPH